MPRPSESTLAAIKQAVDIVSLIQEYLPLNRSGGKYKALCPFHDDHNPSMEVNPDRQTFKCWSCGAGGDVFDFVKDYERVDFPEAKRMLADRAGITLERPDASASESHGPKGPSKTDLLAICAWAEGVFAVELARNDEAKAYVESRGISADSVKWFHLGYAPDARDWLTTKARRAGYSLDLLEAAGLITRKPGTSLTRDRFRGRLIFPIRDGRGRALGFGGRILPGPEKKLAESGLGVAKYLNSPETALFQKRRNLYAADLARGPARTEGWIAVVEGYTDVIAAHQAGLPNFVGTLGTALGDDHVTSLRRLADRVVLVFDGDEAGQKAADRSLELFLGHEVDVRVLTLPDDLDPADFLADRGEAAFREMLRNATDPLEFILGRAANRYDLGSAEGARQAAQWVLSILAKVPHSMRGGLDLKVAKALDTLSRRLGVPVADLHRQLRYDSRTRPRPGRPPEPRGEAAVSTEEPPFVESELDPLDRELIEIVLNEPDVVATFRRSVAVEELRDGPLRSILQGLYDLHAEGEAPDFTRLALRLTDRERTLAAGLLLPIDPAPMPEGQKPASWHDRLAGVLGRLEDRRWRDKARDLEGALREIDPKLHPEDHRALREEYWKHRGRRPDLRKK